MEMPDEAPTQLHEVDAEVLDGSPTEVAENESDMEVEIAVKKEEVDMGPKMEKRKRRDEFDSDGGEAGRRDRDTEESPSKRPPPRGELRPDDRPVSGSELRQLLQLHAQDMKEAWKTFEHRLDKAEGRLDRTEVIQKKQVGDIASLAGRVKINEKDVQNIKKASDSMQPKLDSLTEDVKNLKVQLEEVRNREPDARTVEGEFAKVGPVAQPDPWGDYLRRRNGVATTGGRVPGSAARGDPNLGGEGASGSGRSAGDTLSEEDQRTLIVGGWLQDTRRAVIEAEAEGVLKLPEVAPLLDAEKISVFGPRRSVGMIRFSLREGENFAAMKERMWKVVRAVAQAKVVFQSTRNMGEEKFAWVAFMKTKVARARTAHISMVRRVTIQLAADVKDEGGGVLNLDHTLAASYDMDWSAGTIWCGPQKLASATHRPPKQAEVITMSSGWVNLDAIALVAGCTVEAAKAAFELELCFFWGEGIWSSYSEISRAKDGWTVEDSEHFHWVSFRDKDMWRGVGVGIAIDKFDCVISKVATRRGIWVQVRLVGLGRVVLGSLHAFTGVTNAKYQAAVIEFMKSCPSSWRHLPMLCGADVNETIPWVDAEVEGSLCGVDMLAAGSNNFNVLVEQFAEGGLRPVPPDVVQFHTPTHFPRDALRTGRQIDMLWHRHLSLDKLFIEPDRRHLIGADHAAIWVDVYTRKTGKQQWGNDSRPRRMCRELPALDSIEAVEDVSRLAADCTAPRNNSRLWKDAHRLRRRKKKEWQCRRLSAILQGDWAQYRALPREKERKRGWWGGLLENRSSACLTDEIKDHLEAKLVNKCMTDWDDLLEEHIVNVQLGEIFEPFTIIEMRTVLQEMRTVSAVGPDGVCVALLREIASHDLLAPQLVALVNRIVEETEMPVPWQENFLALLAKVDNPASPKDLRPICVSSVFHKMVTKMVCSRALPVLRTGSRCSGCGKGRQAADVIGTVSRVRDVSHEWKLPLLLCKLDISGAFDKLDRLKVVEFLKTTLGSHLLPHELRYLLAQLRTYKLVGKVPGGDLVEIAPNIGIKQGAPESAELFGMVMDAMLTRLIETKGWQSFGTLDVDYLIFYQDDIFIFEKDFAKLCKRIKVLERYLARAGLHLATNKTKIVANAFYKGVRKAQVGDEVFTIAPADDSLKVLGLAFSFHEPQSQQAKELLGRARGAAAKHRELLQAGAPWGKKVYMISTLVSSQFQWTAGAVYWSHAELQQANTLQLHVLRSAFKLRRKAGENWLTWNCRTMRDCRCWMVHNQVPRWSTTILRLQHTLAGHWARRVEFLGPRCIPHPSLPMTALEWRSTAWWRRQQALSPTVGIRHVGHVYVHNLERQLAEVHGNEWRLLANDRQKWTREREAFLDKWDLKWTRSRQLALSC
ncbi:unnamed protein product [Symbiodinium necroappetens]|uniref:Reverse transcriptase domain-containing protein n=1 Tax=Symbiodinium necroappetens TaxID=1628268 RepID=A0A812V218_9DINO|nr:unnamed protein product [Symbiodinium necroappetens]